MGLYRVLKDCTAIINGKEQDLLPGALVEVELRSEATELCKLGILGPWRNSHLKSVMIGEPAPARMRTKRVGIWLTTSRYYSGGRVHLYQIGLALAQLGAEVFLITDGVPRWGADYPTLPNMKVVLEGDGRIPPDIDLILTDSKGPLGHKALAWKEQYPHTTFACINFETPNWVEKFCPDYAKSMPHNKDVIKEADYLLANSEESAKWLREWLDLPTEKSVGICPPAVNTYALAESKSVQDKPHPRPYAVWSARAASYKGGTTAIASIMELPLAFDLIMIGQPPTGMKGDERHAIIAREQISDLEKYALYRNATVVLAPSKFEGAGLVPMEALSSGTPVAVYDLPVLREIYGEKLLYAKWGDEEDFKRIVLKVAESAMRHEGDEQPGLRELVGTSRMECASTYGHDAMRERIDRLPYFSTKRTRVSAQLIAYYGFVPESLESIYPYADEIFVAFGRTKHTREIDDGSLDRLRAFPDPDNKIRIEERDIWTGGKIEMRQWCLDRMSGNFHLLLDGDEIWTGLDKWLSADIAFGCPRWVNFWHDLDHWVRDYDGSTNRWGAPIDDGGSVCPHYRWSWLRRSYRFTSHPTMKDSGDNRLHVISPDAAIKVPDCRIYHLGHALPKAVMEAKHDFYLTRDGVDDARKSRKKAWHDWNGQVGDCRDGIIEAVNWDLPEIVKRAYEGIKTWQTSQQ